ncbi:pyrimidine reductase family protein [Streptomyces longispororuber]|uniref:pyrimidine reductase family protein n=1 Tax=Streptomyces longispororuber TaxID=68230 RepID=UPI0036FCB2A8
MRRLFPVIDHTADSAAVAEPLTDREWSLAELAEAYAYPELAKGSGAAGEPGAEGASGAPDGGGVPGVWLRANMVSTLDGAAQHDGRSQPISCATDMRIFGTLRGLADAVVVGAETVRLEGYRPARAREAFAARRAAASQPPAPAVVVLSAGLDLDFSLPLFTEPLTPTLLVTGAGAPADRMAAARAAGAEVVIAGEGTGAEPARVLRELRERGLTRLLTEGGPRLLGQFVAAGVLDELCLTVSPMLTAGGAQRISDGPGVHVPERFALTSVLEEGGFLFTRYRRS